MKKKKILIIILFILIILISILLLLGILYLNNNSNYASSFINEEVTIKNFKISIEDISTVDDESSNVKLMVINNDNKDRTLNNLKFILKNNDGNEIAILYAYYPETIKSKKSIEINTSIDVPLNDAVTVDYELID